MSIIGGPVSASAAGAPESKRHVNKAKEKQRSSEALERRRFEDSLELHISQVESTEAAEPLKEHKSEDAESEGHANSQIPFHYPFSSRFTPYGPLPAPPQPKPPEAELPESEIQEAAVSSASPVDSGNGKDISIGTDDETEQNYSIDITG